jgi:hypothetical protein
MSRAREVLEEYRRADAAARQEVDRLLAPAGLVVTELARDGEGWRLRLVPGAGGAVPATPPVPAAEHRVQGEERVTSGVEPLVRAPGESLLALAARGGDRLRITRAGGEGGLRVPPAAAEDRIGWLAGTLVGDTVLALRHLGEPEEGEAVVAELHRQFRLFTQESTRLIGAGEPGPFLQAVDRWMPSGFPRGAAFLSRGEDVAHA